MHFGFGQHGFGGHLAFTGHIGGGGGGHGCGGHGGGGHLLHIK